MTEAKEEMTLVYVDKLHDVLCNLSEQLEYQSQQIDRLNALMEVKHRHVAMLINRVVTLEGALGIEWQDPDEPEPIGHA